MLLVLASVLVTTSCAPGPTQPAVSAAEPVPIPTEAVGAIAPGPPPEPSILGDEFEPVPPPPPPEPEDTGDTADSATPVEPSGGPPPPEPPIPAFIPGQYSIDDATSLWVIVNKHRAYTPIDYAPGDLVAPAVPFNNPPLMRREAASALEQMLRAARAAGVDFVVQSSYRSFATQQRVKQLSIERYGLEVSDQRGARAGHSEHQSGLAVDLTTKSGSCTLDPCFANTRIGRWLAQNSWRYGFVVRYLPGKTDITGYIYEPWHLRYVGPELAAEINRQGYPTLEEFFGLPPAPTYLD